MRFGLYFHGCAFTQATGGAQQYLVASLNTFEKLNPGGALVGALAAQLNALVHHAQHRAGGHFITAIWRDAGGRDLALAY